MLSRTHYLAKTEGCLNPYNICVPMGQYASLAQRADDMNLLLATADAEKQQLITNLQALRDLMKTTNDQERPKKSKSVPKYVANAGANAKAQRRLQNAGKLEPFRSGGCRCRTFNNGLGNQCHARASTDGFCKSHYKKVVVEGNGLWTMGFYDQPRPKIWGEELDGLCHPVPGDRKKGTSIPWKMDEETFAQAFADLNRLDQAGKVELELQDAEETSSGSDVEVEDDTETLPFPDEEALERQNTQELLETLEIAEEKRDPMPGDPDFVRPVGQQFQLDNGMVLEATETGAKVVSPPGTPPLFPKQAMLDQLEKMNEGPIAVDYDILCELREEKKEFEAEHSGASDEGSGDDSYY